MVVETQTDTYLQQLVIRQVIAEDLPALEWEGEYAHYRNLYLDAFERARQGRSVLWVAELPVVGLIGQVFIQLICDRPELADGHERAYLYGFRVREAYRDRGIGTYMMKIIEDDLRQRGFRMITLNVARENTRARHLYERHAYRIVAPEPGIWSYLDEKNIWHTVEEPAWRMEKRLL
ncbi:MAG TPA: GNAT family N-acetyltransferase [Anaerolineaceae bacterium]|nr:GNAT family N-acetyltransferase [Anaerolineaceae bacterium]